MLNVILYLIGSWVILNTKIAPELPRAEIIVEERYDIKEYLSKYNSPLEEYSGDFIRASKNFGFDYKVLVAISGVESGFGTSSLCGDYNPFGYGNPCWDFSSYSEAIWKVAETIGTSEATGYKRFRETGEVYDLATAYNSSYAVEWTEKINYFFNQLK